MATPHVSGVAALYLSKHPQATPAEVSSFIMSSALVNKISGIPSGPNHLLNTEGLLGLAAPTNILVTNRQCYGMNSVSWGAVSGASRYELYGSEDGSFSYSLFLGQTTTTSRMVNVPSSMYVRVFSCDGSECGARPSSSVFTPYRNYCM